MTRIKQSSVDFTVAQNAPRSWYLLTASHKLKPGGLLTFRIGDKELVAYRGNVSRQVFITQAHCPHMGCHFKHGKVVDDVIECALHKRRYNAQGECVHWPAQSSNAMNEVGSSALDSSEHVLCADSINVLEMSASRSCFPVVEHLGGVFVFLGEEPSHSIPELNDSELPIHARLVSDDFLVDFPWYLITANALDVDHLQAVHGREVLQTTPIQQVDNHTIQLTYESRVTGNRLSDHVMRRLSGNRVSVQITVCAGTLIQVESTVGKHKTFLLISLLPQGGKTRIHCLTGVKSRRSRLLNRLHTRIAAWLFLAFIRKDVVVLEGFELRKPQQVRTQGDRNMQRIYDYLNTLPMCY